MLPLTDFALTSDRNNRASSHPAESRDPCLLRHSDGIELSGSHKGNKAILAPDLTVLL
jgi:hypothetical protein